MGSNNPSFRFGGDGNAPSVWGRTQELASRQFTSGSALPQHLGHSGARDSPIVISPSQSPEPTNNNNIFSFRVPDRQEDWPMEWRGDGKGKGKETQEGGAGTGRSLAEKLAEQGGGDTSNWSEGGILFTAIPTTDPPRIHFSDPLGKYRNLSQASGRAFEEAPEPKTLLQLHGGGACAPQETYSSWALLRQLAIVAVGHDNFTLTPPIARVPGDYVNAAPYVFVYHSGREGDVQKLESHAVWAQKAGAFYTLPYEHDSVPEYIGSFQGFTGPKEVPLLAAFRMAVVSGSLKTLTLTLAKTNRAHEKKTADEILVMVHNNIRIKILPTSGDNGQEKPTVALYCTSPSNNMKAWVAWRDAWRRTRIDTEWYLSGEWVPDHTCLGCHGNDHPTGLCPFMALDGWLGPVSRDLYKAVNEKREEKEQTFKPQQRPPAQTSGQGRFGQHSGDNYKPGQSSNQGRFGQRSNGRK
ncbi:hypothetical protein NLI96_g12608 [Meripilus lineatus]|uniref:Uncharacterized protein n=1 Tax=Meripilus lineatus TaxID=2056292 RepID=A0AAD5YC89_9APHY|nr:hypothetical protein NLI96_g12608 [Physisporinus lineatus]